MDISSSEEGEIEKSPQKEEPTGPKTRYEQRKPTIAIIADPSGENIQRHLKYLSKDKIYQHMESIKSIEELERETKKERTLKELA